MSAPILICSHSRRCYMATASSCNGPSTGFAFRGRLGYHFDTLRKEAPVEYGRVLSHGPRHITLRDFVIVQELDLDA